MSVIKGPNFFRIYFKATSKKNNWQNVLDLLHAQIKKGSPTYWCVFYIAISKPYCIHKMPGSNGISKKDFINMLKTQIAKNSTIFNKIAIELRINCQDK